MNIATNFEALARTYDIDPIEAALMDVARLIQITRTMHEEADDHFRGLARHVDRVGSPLEGRVGEVYPSGSFATHTATRSRIRREVHDIDAVIEIDGILDADPETVLDQLYEAVRGEPGSRYYDYPIARHSRCVTVTYPDGVTVDLMPVARVPGSPERVAQIFHSKPAAGESYRKEVNPKGFADMFNAHVEVSATFQDRFDARRLLVEGRTYERMIRDEVHATAAFAFDVRADTQPMPIFVPLDQKAPRVVAQQLFKRIRDKRYRRKDAHRGRRKPPSVISAAQAMDLGWTRDSLFEELVAMAKYQLRSIRAAEQSFECLVVVNPAHKPDRFTDRWPATRDDQRLWAKDLAHLIHELETLRTVGFDPALILRVFDDLFGETVGEFVLKSFHAARTRQIETGTLGMRRDGKFIGLSPETSLAAPMLGAGFGAGSAPAAEPIRPARPNTNMGGVIDDDHHW